LQNKRFSFAVFKHPNFIFDQLAKAGLARIPVDQLTSLLTGHANISSIRKALCNENPSNIQKHTEQEETFKSVCSGVWYFILSIGNPIAVAIDSAMASNRSS
jgi:hypothetical protein